MSTYAIGDIQGCFDNLLALLKLIQFNESKDTLWFIGDLVNRGPKSLEVLRFIKQLGEKHITILGNHDLHLLAVGIQARQQNPQDTLQTILSAPDCDALLTWLRERPLLHYDQDFEIMMVHAGLAPSWTLEQAKQLANEVEMAIRSNDHFAYFKAMYGNEPTHWNNSLTGLARLRCITNYLARVRYCHADGSLALAYKGKIIDKPQDLIPWFEVPNRCNREVKIIFGHWAALEGKVNVPNLFAIDTGCVWGNCLTALRLDDGKRFSTPC